MFLGKPSPLSLRVKSKKAELLLLRKIDASDISLRYPNFFMKFFKRAYFNMLSIKNITIKKIQYYWENLEKKSNLKKPIRRAQTSLKPYTIYKLKDKEKKEISKMFNEHNSKILNIQRTTTQDKKKLKISIKNISQVLNFESSKKSNLSTTNLTVTDFEKKKSVLNKGKTSVGSKTIDSNCHYSSKSPKKTISPTSKGSLRKNHMNKLKIKIKKLKNSKKYYKNLYEKIINLKETDKNSLNKNSDSAVISKLENNNFINEKGKQNINNNEIKNSEINKNINHLNKSKTINEESSVESESLNDKNSPRKFNLDKFKINSEINLFIKSKYINLEKFTDGEFSKNDDLQKQSLNFIKVFLEVGKKAKKKKLNLKNLKEKRKSFYSINNDLRAIMNKFN